MEISIADQIALDDALVAPADRLKIGKCNLRLSSDVTSKEATLQVVYDVLKLTPFYKAFQVTADAPEIYMQEFWASAYVHNRSVRFKMNNKKHILDLDQFRDILQICPKVGNKKFEEPPLEKEILAFLASLGHSGEIRKITDVNVNKLHQPWRSFAAIINKCLSGKPSYDSLRLSQAQILWGMYNKKKVDYAYLLWEDFTFKIAETKIRRRAMRWLQEQFLLRQKEARRKLNTEHIHSTEAAQMPPSEKKILVLHQGFSDAPDYDQRMISLGIIVSVDKMIEQAQLTLCVDIIHEEETDEDDSRISSSDDEDSDNEVEGANVAGAKSDEEATDEEDQGNEAVEDTNTDLDGRDADRTDVILPQVQATQEIEDTHVTLTPVNPDGQQQSSSVSSGFVSNMLNPNQDTGVDDILLVNITEATSLLILLQTNQYAEALSSIPSTVDQYLANEMQEAVDVAVQLKYDRIREESASANQQFLDSIDEGMKKISRIVKKGNDDQEPSAGTDWGSKRRRSGKEPDSSALSGPGMNKQKRGPTSSDWFHTPTRLPFLLIMHGNKSVLPFIETVTKTTAADYGHIKWIEDLVPNLMWSQTIVKYDKFALWGISHWVKKSEDSSMHLRPPGNQLRDIYLNKTVIASPKGKVTTSALETEWHLMSPYRMFTRRVVIQEAWEDVFNWMLKAPERNSTSRRPNTLMRIDELHKFSDGTLDDVRTALNDRLKGIRMEYLPQTFWSQRDKANARAMIQAIDKRLKFNTTAGNPVKKILLKLNLSDHRSILTDSKVTPTKPGRMTKPYSSPCFIANYFRYSDTTHLSRSVEVLKLKNFKKDATLKLFKNGMSMSVQKSQVHKMAKRLCLVDDLKMLKITMSNTSSRNKLNPRS
ncbi:hypothetical protein Tco_0140160 [Tanacetum coccineum]